MGKTFPMERVVTEGDVISPLLFNAGLEQVMRRWALRLRHCGLDLRNGEILTNAKHAVCGRFDVACKTLC